MSKSRMSVSLVVDASLKREMTQLDGTKNDVGGRNVESSRFDIPKDRACDHIYATQWTRYKLDTDKTKWLEAMSTWNLS